MSTSKETNEMTAHVFATALALALINKGLLSQQEIKEAVAELTRPMGEVGTIISNDILLALHRVHTQRMSV